MCWRNHINFERICTIIQAYGSMVNQQDEIDGLVQERRNSSALALELRLSCTNPLNHPNKQNISHEIYRIHPTNYVIVPGALWWGSIILLGVWRLSMPSLGVGNNQYKKLYISRFSMYSFYTISLWKERVETSPMMKWEGFLTLKQLGIFLIM